MSSSGIGRELAGRDADHQVTDDQRVAAREVEGDLGGRLAGHGHDLDVTRDCRAARHRPVGARLEPA
jgi:hypothetical protein